MNAAGHFNQQLRTPESHFRLHWFGAILYLRGLLPGRRVDDGLAVLDGYYDELDAFGFEDGAAPAASPLGAPARRWEAARPRHLPLRALRERCGSMGSR